MYGTSGMSGDTILCACSGGQLWALLDRDFAYREGKRERVCVMFCFVRGGGGQMKRRRRFISAV